MRDDNELTRALRQTSERTELTPSGLGDVHERARRIRRRRTAVAVAGSAAVVAVIAGVGVAVTPGLNGSDDPPVLTPAPGPMIELDERVETDAPLPVPQWSDGELTAPGWQRPVDTADRVTQMVWDDAESRWYAMRHDDTTGGNDLLTIDADGNVVDEVTAHGEGVAITPDGGTWAWLTPGETGPHLTVSGDQQWEADLPPSARGLGLEGFLPNGAVVYDRDGATAVVTPDGESRTVPGARYPEAASAATGKIVVQRSESGSMAGEPARSCWGLIGNLGRDGPTTCDYIPMGFNADGTQLFAIEAGAENLAEGTARLFILDAENLEPLATFSAPEGAAIYVHEASFVGDEVVVPVRGTADGEDSWALARLSTDGILIQEGTVTPTNGEWRPPYTLGAGPLE